MKFRNVKPHLPPLFVDDFAQQLADVMRERAADAAPRGLEFAGLIRAGVAIFVV